ncbi:MAG: PHP domain-containing protein [Oscillospiraceae bacterium]|nr:PHP domain-containing protein [Oscillospiraceae bacterium]
MQDRLIDLHTHTTTSDGSFTPAELVALASKLGLSAVAITDHDTISGYPEACKAAENTGVEVIPGLEISTRYHSAVHILGYYVNINNQALLSELSWIVWERDQRNERIRALMREDGLPVDYSGMKTRFGDVVGRPHFARLLVEYGLAVDVRDAFRRYLERGQRYFQARTFLSIERSVEIIALSGGIPVLAHPFQYRLDEPELRELIEYCMQHGLRGIECLYSGYTEEQSLYLKHLASEYGLLVTGGSDFHGSAKPHIQLGCGTGDLAVPYALLEGLKEEQNKKSLKK